MPQLQPHPIEDDETNIDRRLESYFNTVRLYHLAHPSHKAAILHGAVALETHLTTIPRALDRLERILRTAA